MKHINAPFCSVLCGLLLLASASQAQAYRPFRHADIQPTVQDNQPVQSSYDASTQSYQSSRHIAGTTNPFESAFDANNQGINAIANPNAGRNSGMMERITAGRDLSDAHLYTGTESENTRTYNSRPNRVTDWSSKYTSTPPYPDDESTLAYGDEWVDPVTKETLMWDGYDWVKRDGGSFGGAGTVLPVGSPMVLLLFAACAALVIFFRRRVHNA